MNAKLPPAPFQNPIAGNGGLASEVWNRWFSQMLTSLESCMSVAGSTTLTGQAASIGATAFGDALPAGLYRVEYHMRVTQAATVSSSLTFTVSWTDGGVAQSYSWAAMTGNTTATAQSAATLVHVDPGSSVSYATSYASAGATPMQYRLDGVLYRVGNL